MLNGTNEVCTVSVGRTGSTLLMVLLRSARNVLSLSEIFRENYGEHDDLEWPYSAIRPYVRPLSEFPTWRAYVDHLVQAASLLGYTVFAYKLIFDIERINSTFHLEQFVSMSPQTRFIVLRRRPIDVFISMNKARATGRFSGLDYSEKRFQFDAQAYSEHRFYQLSFETYMQALLQKNGRQFAVLDYEKFGGLQSAEQSQFVIDFVRNKLGVHCCEGGGYEHHLPKQNRVECLEDNFVNPDDYRMLAREFPGLESFTNLPVLLSCPKSTTDFDYMNNIELLNSFGRHGDFSPGTSLPSTLQGNAHLHNIARFPDFYCIGAHRAGTTWLFERLRRNPYVWLPALKVVDHFSEMYLDAINGWMRAQRERRIADCDYPPEFKAAIDGLGREDAAYGRLYAAAPPGCRTGDFSTEYMLLPPAAIAHLRRLSPHAKIVIIVRDPVERFWSHAKHLAAVAEGINQDLVERIIAMPHVLARSDYAEVIRRWTYYFERHRILVGDFDHLRTEPERLLRQVCEFLEINGVEYCYEDAGTNVHETFSMKMPEEMYTGILQVMAPYIYSFARFMPEIGEAWVSRHKL